jgi:starvation-inducible outer membrane lipoprotein
MALLCLVLQGCETAPLSQSQKQEKRASVREMAKQSHEQLYQAQPGAR